MRLRPPILELACDSSRQSGFPDLRPAIATLDRSMRIAALDLGSNSFHLLVADVHPDGTFETVTREKDMLRLGHDVARYGRISPSSADRAVASVRRFRQLADGLDVQEVIAKATSAIRTAANGSELV